MKVLMQQIRSTAKLHKIANNQGSYVGLNSNEKIIIQVRAINNELKQNNTIILSPDNQKWCLKISTGQNNYFCVDSLGHAIESSLGCDSEKQEYSCR